MQASNDPDKKTVSVIILSYNCRSDLAECLPSMVGQAYTDHEIIVVDNGSSDGTPDLMKANYPDVKFVENDANLGYGGGNNVGFRHATGEFIVVVNPDTVADKNWLSELIKPFEVDPKIAITTSKILMYGEKHCINTCGNHSHFTGLNFCRGLSQPDTMFNEPMEVGAISGCSFAIRRKALEELGGFDSSFFLYLEDDDLSWRARLAGYKIMYVPSSVIYHKYRLSIAPWKEYYLERNRHMLLLKNYKLKTLVLLLPVLLVTELMTWGHAILSGLPYLHSKLRAYWWIIKNFNMVMVQRREAQKHRIVGDKELIRLLDWRIPFEQVIDNRLIQKLANLIFNIFYSLYFVAVKIMI